ncbi:MAG: hypothetical protein MJZ90_07350 [Bacteroidales bacterium]|mgnify:FL=1|nr:hypothetical protein [Bacteroidales bacterium]
MLDGFLEKILSWFDDENNIMWLKGHIIYFILILAFIIFLVWFLKYISSKRRRAHLNFHIHHLIYKLGFRKTISRHWIGRTHVHECYDPLVDFLPHKHIIFNDETLEQPNLIRKKVLFKLYRIADRLPNGMNLLILQTYRSKSKMNEAWEKTINEITADNPGIGRYEAIKLAKFKTEDPKNSIGGHVTGGAVDVALCDDNGVMLDFGTKFHEHNNKTETRNKYITKTQAKNRKTLVRMMRREGFINFPAEWWHFSYGDRAWAAYKGRRHGGIYGSAETEMDGKYGFTIPVHRVTYDSSK